MVREFDQHRPSISRRAALKSLAAGAGAAPCCPGCLTKACSPSRRSSDVHLPQKSYPRERLRHTAGTVEAIIPADERSPGAREARVADYSICG